MSCYQFFMNALARYCTPFIAKELCMSIDSGHARIPGRVLIDVLCGNVSVLSNLLLLTSCANASTFAAHYTSNNVWFSDIVDRSDYMNSRFYRDYWIRLESLDVKLGCIRLVDFRNLVARCVTLFVRDWLTSCLLRTVRTMPGMIGELEIRLADYHAKGFSVVIDKTGCEDIQSLLRVNMDVEVSEFEELTRYANTVDVSSCPVLCPCNINVKKLSGHYHDTGCPVKQCDCDAHVRQSDRSVEIYEQIVQVKATEELEGWLAKDWPAGYTIIK